MCRDTGNTVPSKVLYCIPAALLACFLLQIIIDFISKVNYNNDFIVFTYSSSDSSSNSRSMCHAAAL